MISNAGKNSPSERACAAVVLSRGRATIVKVAKNLSQLESAIRRGPPSRTSNATKPRRLRPRGEALDYCRGRTTTVSMYSKLHTG